MPKVKGVYDFGITVYWYSWGDSFLFFTPSLFTLQYIKPAIKACTFHSTSHTTSSPHSFNPLNPPFIPHPTSNIMRPATKRAVAGPSRRRRIQDDSDEDSDESIDLTPPPVQEFTEEERKRNAELAQLVRDLLH